MLVGDKPRGKQNNLAIWSVQNQTAETPINQETNQAYKKEISEKEITIKSNSE